MSDKIDFTTTGPDANGWMMTKISDSLAIWTIRKQLTGVSYLANTSSYRNDLMISHPVDMVSFIGGSVNGACATPVVKIFPYLGGAATGSGNIAWYYYNSGAAATSNAVFDAIILGTYA